MASYCHHELTVSEYNVGWQVFPESMYFILIHDFITFKFLLCSTSIQRYVKPCKVQKLNLENRLSGGISYWEGLQVQCRFCLVAVDLKVNKPILCTQFIYRDWWLTVALRINHCGYHVPLEVKGQLEWREVELVEWIFSEGFVFRRDFLKCSLKPFVTSLSVSLAYH